MIQFTVILKLMMLVKKKPPQLIGRDGHRAPPLAASPPIRSEDEDWKYSAEEVQSISSSLYSSLQTPLTGQNFKIENKYTDSLTLTFNQAGKHSPVLSGEIIR